MSKKKSKFRASQQKSVGTTVEHDHSAHENGNSANRALPLRADDSTTKDRRASKGEGRSAIDKLRLVIEVLTLLAVATYAWITYRQWREMRNQTATIERQMHQDQRPWLKITLKTGNFQVGAPRAVAGTIVNLGKTPALEITGETVFEEVINGEEPRLNYAEPHPRMSVGTMFPNDPQSARVWSERRNPDGSISEDAWTPEQVQSFKQGKAFFVAYGRISYRDGFHVEHWTRFCQYFYFPDVNGVTARRCAEYNKTDDN